MRGKAVLIMGVAFAAAAVAFGLADLGGIRGFLIVGYVFLTAYNLAGLLSIRFTDGPRVSIIGLVGFLVGLIDSLRLVEFLVPLIPWPADVPAILRRVDPLGVIQFPFVGVWVISLALRQEKWAKVSGVAFGLTLFLPALSETINVLGYDQLLIYFLPLLVLSIAASLVWGCMSRKMA